MSSAICRRFMPILLSPRAADGVPSIVRKGGQSLTIFRSSTSATPPMGLGIAPPADVFVVTFGADGKVASYRRPLVGPYAEPQDPDDPPRKPPD